MKCISLWQPWASAIACGSKTIETRSWRTHYRGPLAIHAAKRRVISELISYSCCGPWEGALSKVLPTMRRLRWFDALPFGAVVAVVNLVDCRPTGAFTQGEIHRRRRPAGQRSRSYDWAEADLGDFGPGRFGWVLRDVVMLDTPVAWRGCQGFFAPPAGLPLPTHEETTVG